MAKVSDDDRKGVSEISALDIYASFDRLHGRAIEHGKMVSEIESVTGRKVAEREQPRKTSQPNSEMLHSSRKLKLNST